MSQQTFRPIGEFIGAIFRDWINVVSLLLTLSLGIAGTFHKWSDPSVSTLSYAAIFMAVVIAVGRAHVKIVTKHDADSKVRFESLQSESADAQAAREAKINALQAEISELRARRPNLDVGFWQDGALAKTVSLDIHEIPEPDLDAEVERKRRELLEKLDEARLQNSVTNLGTLDEIFGKEINPKYPQRVEDYLRIYREHYHMQYMYRMVVDRFKSLSLAVQNGPGFVADSVRLEITTPQDVIVDLWGEQWRELWKLAQKSSDEVSRLPKEPKIYLSLIGYNLLGEEQSPTRTVPSAFTDMSNFVVNRVHDPVRGPYYRDGGVAVYEINRVNPGSAESDLEPLTIWLGNIREDTEIDLVVRLGAMELPEPLEAHLRVEVRYQPAEEHYGSEES